MKIKKLLFFGTFLAVVGVSCSKEEPIPTYSVSVEVNNPLYGSAYINNEGTAALVVEEGDNVTLHALPSEEGVFSNWEITSNNTGANVQTVTENPYTIVGVRADYTATAVFERATKYYEVTLTVEGGQYGSAYINTEGISNITIAEGGSVELHAQNNEEGVFASWSYSQNGQQVTSDDNPLTISNINESLNVKASFEPLPYTVTVSSSETEFGSVYINVDGKESAKVGENSTVEIYAVPTQKGYFYSWSYTSGGKNYTSIDNPLVLSDFKSDVTISANFIDMSNVLFVDDFDQDSEIPDPAKWVLCPKGTSDWNNTCSESYDQTIVKDGILHLIGEKVGANYKTGAVEWPSNIGFEHVKIEVTAKLATLGQGQWPAIWMMPRKPIYSGWPACGEIDIMEHLNRDAFYYSTIHSKWIDTSGNRNNPLYSKTITFNRNDWNTYGLEWDDNAIVFYLNGVEVFRYTNLHLKNEATAQQWPFNTTFYLKLSQQLGGNWVGSITDSQLPADMMIDRVLVTKLDQ